MSTLIVQNNGNAVFNDELEAKVIDYLSARQTSNDRYNKIRRAIKKEMLNNDLKAIESENLSLSYSPKTYRVTFDVSRFREDYPELYSDYIQATPVKDSVKIVIKKPKTNPKK